MATGHVEHRASDPKRHMIVLDLGRDENGKRIRKYIPFRGGKKEAQQELARLLTEANRGVQVLSTSATVEEYLKEWLEQYARPNLAPSTFQSYERIIKKHLIPALGTIQLRELQPIQIQNYCTKALKSGRRDGNGGLSCRTVQYHFRVLSEALRHAVRWQLIGRNPADAVDPPRPKRPQVKALNAAEVEKLLTTAQEEEFCDYRMVVVTVYTGMRLGEILGLQWDDVDLDNGRLSVIRTLQRLPEKGFFFKEPKTARGRRQIVLPPTAVKVLKEQKKHLAAAKLQCGPAWVENNLVFPLPDGRPQDPSAVSKRFAKFAAEAGFPGFPFHGLRHTHASLLLAQGVHPKVVQERLGHETISITLDTYSHVIPSLQSEAADKFEELLSQTKGRQMGGDQAKKEAPGR